VAGLCKGARPAIGRRSLGVPHGSVRAFQQQQQQQQHSSRTLLVVPTSSRSARGGSVSTSPSSASPSPSPEPVSRHVAATRSLSTQRPLGVTRTTLTAASTSGATDEHCTGKPSRTVCVQRHHCDQRQLTTAGTGAQTARPDELHEQETFV